MAYIYLSDQNQERLERIVATGLYGESEADVAAGAIMAMIREAIQYGFIKADPPPLPLHPEGAEFAEVGEEKLQGTENLEPPVPPPAPLGRAPAIDDDIPF